MEILIKRGGLWQHHCVATRSDVRPYFSSSHSAAIARIPLK
jgi:hypothetical protein